MQTEQPASGVLQINEKGFGFLRHAGSNYLPSPKDVFVPRNLIQHFRLREGVQLTGTATPGENGRGGRGRVQSDQLTSIELITIGCQVDPPTVTFVVVFSGGTGTINGVAMTSGVEVSVPQTADGLYYLVVTNGTQTATLTDSRGGWLCT